MNVTPRVLYVDDDLTFLEVVAETLREAGISVKPMQSAIDALEYIKNEHVDLVITDYLMPGNSGAELSSFCKSKGIGCIVVSGYWGSDIGKDLPENTPIVSKLEFLANDSGLVAQIRAVMQRRSNEPRIGTGLKNTAA